jgi:hypothetical protein
MHPVGAETAAVWRACMDVARAKPVPVHVWVRYARATMRAPIAFSAALWGCAGPASKMPALSGWQASVVERDGKSDLGSLQLRPEVCRGYDLKSDYGTLTEASFVRFLQVQGINAQVRQVQQQLVDPGRPDLHYVFLNVPGITDAVPLRVAILPNADDAGRALHDAVLERGSGAWGVHRSNVAVLGPNGAYGDDIAFAATTKLACWGTLTIAGADDAFVIPGGYSEP